MSVKLAPAAVVIPTRNRAATLRRTFESLAAQSVQPVDVIVVDASDEASTRLLCLDRPVPGLASSVAWHRAEAQGAASQRTQGVRACSQSVIGFMDDDILFEPSCFERLWTALQSDSRLGGVNAMITNQRYQPPGRISRSMFRLMAGGAQISYAGRVLGPAVNLLPEDRDNLPDVVPVEWLNTTCTLYRREALPDPAFPSRFTGYSLMEDLTLSLTVGKHWKLANARTARIYHDSQPGSHKSDPALLSEMHLLNRHYVMKYVLGRNRFQDYWKLAVWIAFSHLSALALGREWRRQPATLIGECRAIRAILLRRDASIDI
jgi:glycosyltransferase involved in cell wall biosynthesis